MKDKWLNDIHDRISQFDIEEPTGLWDDIASGLTGQEDIHTEKSRSRLFLWVKRATGIAAMLVIAIGTILWIANHDRPVERQSDMRADINNHTGFNDKHSNSNNYAPQQKKNKKEPTTAIKWHIEGTSTKTPETGMPLADGHISEQKIKATETLPNSITQQKSSDTKTETDKPDSQIKTLNRHDNYHNRYIVYVPKHKSEEGRLSISTYTSGGLNSTFNHTSTSKPIATIGPDNTEWEDDPMLAILLFNQGKDVETEVKHRLPIRTGISFEYRINDRFTIGTGLTYTNLTSDLKSGSENHYFSGTQKLHYLGIPLSVRYRALTWKRIELYTTAGALAEKCIKGETNQDYFLDNQNRASESKSTKVRPLQWSVNAAVGLQFNASSVIGLYAEPGISYYIDNGSPIKTIYKDKPFNFNLNIGLRFTFVN